VVKPRGTTLVAARGDGRGLLAWILQKKILKGVPSLRLTGHLELFNLHLAEPLDVLEVLLRRVRETLDGVNASLEELLDIGRRDTVFLR
jgi:hypothetical protein